MYADQIKEQEIDPFLYFFLDKIFHYSIRKNHYVHAIFVYGNTERGFRTNLFQGALMFQGGERPVIAGFLFSLSSFIYMLLDELSGQRRCHFSGCVCDKRERSLF